MVLGAFALGIGLFSGLEAVELPAPQVPAEPPPLAFEDEQGIVYILLTDLEGAPLLVNGSPLYQANFGKGSKRSTVNLTADAIAERARIRKVEQEGYKSPWANRSLSFEMNSSVMENFLNYFEARPEAFRQLLSSTSDAKSILFRSLLFGDEVVVSKEDLMALRASAQDPQPDPVVVRFPVEENLPTLAELTSEWFVQIAIEHLSFKLRKKLIRFDPLQNIIRIRLECTQAVLKGPTLSVGRITLGDFYKYPVPLKDWWPFGWGEWLDENRQAYWKKENELLSGDVGPLSLELDIRFYQDGDGFWRIGLADKLKFVAEGDSPKVIMTYRDEVPTENGLSKTQTLSLTKWAQDIIADTLTSTLEGAFSSGFLPDEIAFGVEMEGKDFPAKGGEAKVGHAMLQTRLSDFRISKSGLQVAFDSRALSETPSPCLLSTPPRALPASEVKPLEVATNFRAEPWTLERSAQTGGKWSASHRDQLALELRANGGFGLVLEQVLHLSGRSCIETSEWKSRDGSVPKAQFRPDFSSSFVLGENSLDLKFSGAVDLYSRDYQSLNEKFVLSKSTPVLLKPKIRWNQDLQRFQLSEESSLEFFKMSPAENQLVKDLLRDVFPQDLLSMNHLSEEWGRGQWTVLDLRLSKKELGVSVGLLPGFFENLDSILSPDRSARKRSEDLAPLATFQERSPILLTNRFVTLQWDSPRGTPFFSWRVRSVADGQWSEWSEFSREKSATILRDKPGNYQLEVKGMNLAFDIQPTPTLLDFAIPERAIEQSPGESQDKRPEWKTPESSTQGTRVPQKAAVRKVEPVKDGGLFGCSITAEGTAQSPPRQSRLILMVGLVLGIALWRVRRRLADRADSSDFSSPQSGRHLRI